MRRFFVFAVVSALGLAFAPANAQINPPSIDPSAFPPGFVTSNFYGPEIRLQNTTPTANIELQPFTPQEFFQAPELTNPSGSATPIERLFRHDYQFTVPTQVSGGSRIQDLPLQIGMSLFEDILQLSFGLFGTSVDQGNLVAGLATQAPPPSSAAAINFADLVPGTQYILRVAGVLNGFSRIPAGHEGAGMLGWHGQYQGNIGVVPLPAAVVFFLTALVGLLGAAGWQRFKAA